MKTPDSLSVRDRVDALFFPRANGDPPGDAAPDASKRSHIRGSSLLLAGRLLSIGINLVSQVLAVRFFTKGDYGALAYGLSVVTLGTALSGIGFDKAASRYLPIYREHGETAKLTSAIVLMVWTIAAIGIAVVTTVGALDGVLSPALANDPTAAALLLILIPLAPVGAFDNLLVSLFAVFTGARAIFFRKHLLGPLLKLAATVAVVATGGSIRALAWGLVAAGVTGTGFYAATLLRTLAKQDLAPRWRRWWRDAEAGELFRFSLPLFGSEVVFLLRSSVVVLILGHFKNAAEVAAYQAVVPAGRLNILVRESFAYLFVPMAARLLARNDRAGIADLYRHTTCWVAILTFPVFVVTFVFGTPIVTLLFGDRYADSGRILSILALAQFFNASAGLASLTLRALGKVRTIIFVDVVITVLALSLNFILIPRWGALGAAFATAATLITHSFLNIASLYRAGGILLFDALVGRVFVSIGLSTGLLATLQAWLHPSPLIGVPLALVVVATVVVANRHVLDVTETFPQVARIGVLRRFFSPATGDAAARRSEPR